MTLNPLRGGCPERRCDAPKVAKPDPRSSRSAVTIASRVEFLLSRSCPRSLTGPRPTPGRASCRRWPLLASPLPLAGGRGGPSPHFTPPPFKTATRRTPQLSGLTSIARCLGNGERDFRLPGTPRPLPPTANAVRGRGLARGRARGAGLGAGTELSGLRGSHQRALRALPPRSPSSSGYRA